MSSRSPALASIGVDRPVAGLLSWLPQATALAAAVELVILRIFTRTAIHIPGVADLRVIFVPISEVGRFAFYLAAVLLTVTLALLAVDVGRRGSMDAYVGAGGLVLFLSAAVTARIGATDDLSLDIATVAAILLLAPWALGDLAGRSRLPGLLLVSALLLTSLVGTEQAIAGAGDGIGDRAWPTLIGEMLAVSGAVSAPLIVGRTRSRPALVWGAVIGGMVFAGLLANASTVKILLLWNFGLAGYLPSILYGVAAGAVAYTIVALRAAGQRSYAAAIALLFMGGIGLHSTYQTGLVLAGLALLGRARIDPRFDAPAVPDLP
jgi:hypothetical protein